MKRTIMLTMCLIVQVGTHVYGRSQSPGTFKQQPAPLGFEENKGQITDQHGNMRQDIQYTLKAPGLTVFIGSGAIHYQFYRTEAVKDIITPAISKAFKGQKQPVPTRTTTYRMDVNLPGANTGITPVASEGIGGVNHYYTNVKLKNDITVHTYQKLTYTNIYPGIDWVLYVQNGNLKYDFIVHSGGSVSAIQLQYNGASSLALEKDGSLHATTPYGIITEQAPVAYQAADKKNITSGFVLNHNILSYKVNAGYSGTLDIDPHVVWATYYGQGTEYNAFSVACDPAGYIYMAGSTFSPDDIATTGSFQDTLSGYASFVAKFDSLGNRIWGTYYGGAGIYISAFGITFPTPVHLACDSTYHVYLSGTTADSAGIATPGSHQDTLALGGTYYTIPVAGVDAFLVQFDSSGVRQWGTYFGGNKYDAVSSVACGNRNYIYICGGTNSINGIATTGCYQSTLGPCVNCVTNGTDTSGSFIAQFDSTGTLQWGTYYGDGNQYEGAGILGAVSDAQGNLDIYGELIPDATIVNTAYATSGAFEPESDGSYDTYLDHYVAQINSSGLRNWGTFWHPTDSNANPDGGISGIACDGNNHVYIGGSTDAATGISTPGSFIENIPIGLTGLYANFVAQFNGTNGQRNWATYYCGNSTGDLHALSCDAGGFLYISGTTIYPNVVPPIQYAYATPYVYQDSLIGTQDIFIAQFDSTGNRHWATYFGGGGEGDEGNSIACDGFGNMYLFGNTTSSANVATQGSYQDTLGTLDSIDNSSFFNPSGQINNVFLVRFTPIDIAITGLVHDTVCVGEGTISITLQNKGHLPESSIVSNAFYVYYDQSTGISDTSTASATTGSSLAPGATTTVTLSGLNFHPGTDTVQIYLQHIIDDSSFVDDTLYAVVYAIDSPSISGITSSDTGIAWYFSASNAQNVTHYQWYFGDGNTATGAATSHTYNASGNYTVILVASNGCKSDTVTTSISATGLGVANLNNTGNITVYPNPAQQQLNIHVPEKIQATEWEIINSVGTKVYMEKTDGQNGSKLIDVHSLSDGYYILKVGTNEGNYNIPFEIMK